jgi:hypothetical protein
MLTVIFGKLLVLYMLPSTPSFSNHCHLGFSRYIVFVKYLDVNIYLGV